MSANLTGLAYLIAAVCFILALRGLSSPVTARRGNMIGIAGMVIAIATTLAGPGVLSYSWIVAGILIGGAIGTVTALRIQMTALPQLVAAFHSLVGLRLTKIGLSARQGRQDPPKPPNLAALMLKTNRMFPMIDGETTTFQGDCG